MHLLSICVYPPVSEVTHSADLQMQQAPMQSPLCLFGDHRFIFLKGSLSGSGTNMDANKGSSLDS